METVNDRAPAGVAELQGLYGPFTFSEKLLQKIWLQREFDQRRAFTTDGRAVRIGNPGRWNLLGGPDFKGARLRIGDTPEKVGDVELHLYATDWDAHRHAQDAAYDDVALHVVLFPPAPDYVTRGAKGPIPVLSLLPILLHDLEEYATEDAVEALARRPARQILDRLAPLPVEHVATLLEQHTQARWDQKVHFARLRIQRLGWTEACHHTALEILGYRFNRAAMLRVASAFPLSAWTQGGLDPVKVFAAEGDQWSLQAQRPANHPRRRLQQYAKWTSLVPDWPEMVARMAGELPPVDATAPTDRVRREAQMSRVRDRFEREVCGDAIGGTRLDTLVCDGLLPLVAAHTEHPSQALWRHWFAGDLPPVIMQALRGLGLVNGRATPASHGRAQGMIGWLLEQERVEAGLGGRGA